VANEYYLVLSLVFLTLLAGYSFLVTHRLRGLREVLRSTEEIARFNDEFLMNLSHQLRTPLTAILGWSDLIQRGEVEAEEFPEILSIIEKSARSELRLVEDLLDMSKMVRGKITLTPRTESVGEITDAVISRFEPAAEAKGVNLVYHPRGNAEGALWCDSERVQQVLGNLLSNAVKFTPAGGTISLSVLAGLDYIEWEVVDSGEGIDATELPLLFERSSRMHGGLGLGLFIAHHLVELHGGKITAQSQGKKKGSQFTVRLPSRQQASAVVEQGSSRKGLGAAEALV